MDYALLSSYDTVQVLSASSTVDVIYCTIVTSGSGSIVQRAVPKSEFVTDQGAGILNSLATAVDDAISGGLADSAVGTQDIDDSGLLYDGVVFTVSYTPSTPTAGPITTTVTVPVNVLTADISFGGFLGMGNKLFAIPWSALTVQPEERRFMLDVPRERLEQAPGFERENWPDMASLDWGSGVYSYYGISPYWM